MYPEDIELLFPRIDIGTPVYIVNQPIKAGWRSNTLYIEVHPDLQGGELIPVGDLPGSSSGCH